MKKLPPLNSLRAFEAAARHLNFVLAAKELHVTAGAISHQIKILEHWLESPVFDRRSSGVVLTTLGLNYAARIRKILAQLEDATLQATNSQAARNIIVRCQFSIGTNWLAPRIGAFCAAHPDLRVVVRAEPYSADPLAGKADIAIYYSAGPQNTFRQIPLIRGTYMVAAAPALLATHGIPRSKADFMTMPLVHLDHVYRGWREPDWSNWFDAAGVQVTGELPGLTFSMLHLVLEACRAGAGFALINDALAGSSFTNGELARADDWELAAPHEYQLIMKAGSPLRPEVQLLVEWLLDAR